MSWACGIDGCGAVFDDVESAIVHQARNHEHLDCEICGTAVPDGFLAIRHAFSEHSRAEYVRAYGADSGDIRRREELIDEIEGIVDVDSIVRSLEK